MYINVTQMSYEITDKLSILISTTVYINVIQLDLVVMKSISLNTIFINGSYSTGLVFSQI